MARFVRPFAVVSAVCLFRVPHLAVCAPKQKEKEVVDVIFFGSSGVGKTTICNAISGTKNRTSSPLTGTSREDLGEHALIKKDGFNIRVNDTSGLNGTYRKDEIEACVHDILKLAVKKRGQGTSLLVMVKDYGQVTAVEKENLKVLKRIFPTIPVVIIFNKCRNTGKDERNTMLHIVKETEDFTFNNFMALPYMKNNDFSSKEKDEIIDFLIENHVYKRVEVSNAAIIEGVLELILGSMKLAGYEVDMKYVGYILRLLGVAEELFEGIRTQLIAAGFYFPGWE